MAVEVKINTIEAHYQLAYKGQQHAIARAPNGILWVVYFEFVGAVRHMLVAYSTNGGETWTEEVVPNTDDVLGWDGLSIMVDTDNVPHIIYYQEMVGLDEIRCINRQGGVWGAPETVHTESFVVVVKAVIDGNNTIHIVFDRTNLNYISGVSGSWSAAEVADVGGTRPNITVNNNNQPVIVFDDGINIYIRYKDGIWQARDTVSAINTWPMSEVAVDGAGDYHVAWQNEEDLAPWNFEVYYKKKESGVWLARLELDTDANEWNVGLGLDDENNAYAFYQSEGADEAVYYRKVTDGTTLGVETVIDAGILQPNNNPSTFAFLCHKYPTSGTLAASYQPIVVLLDEVPVGFPYADLYFYAGTYLPMPVSGGGNPGVVELLT